MNMIKVKDKPLFTVGVVLIFFSLALLAGHQLWTDISEGHAYIETDEMERKATVDGYESPEEAVEYVLYQIHQGDLDLAIRGCAVQEVSGYFSLQNYLEIIEEFPDTAILAPADNDDRAYIEINQAKMVAIYSDMLEQCMGILGDGYDLDVLRIIADIPEDADGYYFQEIRDICAITGARDVCNVTVDLLIDGVPRQMKLTAARYRKYWKVLQFSEYKNYQYSEPQISEYADQETAEKLPLEWESLEDAVLPCNYQIANSTSEKEIKDLVEHLFIYLQRGDIWKAMSYFNVCTLPLNLYPDSLFFYRQSQAAEQLQEFYYRLLLYDRDQMSWINQNVKSESVNLISLLDTSVMVYTSLTAIEVPELEDDKVNCDIAFSYNGGMFSGTVSLINREGWRIEDIKLSIDEDRLLFDYSLGKWCVFRNGIINEEYTGLIENHYGWWYAKNGILNREYEGLAENENGWWYIQNGTVAWGYEGLVQNENGWWYIQNGTVAWGYEGLVQNENGWWYIQNGTVAWGYEGIAQNENGWWYIQNGTVAWDYTGMVTDQGITYSVTNGQVER